MNADHVAENHSVEEPIERLLLKALARRGRRMKEAVSRPVAIPSLNDREAVRDSRAVSKQVAVNEVTGVELEESIRQIQADAATDAEQFVAYLRQMAEQLRSVGCITHQDIDDFVEAMDRVLLQLYQELQKPRPSPTRLLQLVAQFAQDPRRPIDVPVHHIDVRQADEGVTIAVLPTGVGRLRSIPYPGTVVRNPFAAQLLEYVLSSPPNFSAAMQAIEMLLGYVPDFTSPAALQPPAGSPNPAIRIDYDASCITALGRSYVVDLAIVQIFQCLLKVPGGWVSSKELYELPLLKGARIDRLLKKLPQELREFIEASGGKGYRLRMERLCQESSMVMPAKNGDDR